MVRNPTTEASASEINAINLTRMVSRLHHMLVTPDSATEAKLRTSRYEREKVGTNLEYAKTLLVTLEQEVETIRHPTKKHDMQTDLERKRGVLEMLNGRLQELKDLGDHNLEPEEDSSDGEDLLGEDTPDDETDDQDPTPPPTASDTNAEHTSPLQDPQTVSSTSRPDFQSSFELRSRVAATQKEERAELLSTGKSSGNSITTTSEALLTHNRTEQESLTNSLLSMATQIKEQTNAFAAALDEDKVAVKRADEGMNRNEAGLEAATRKMGFLRGYTEGKGWWGRMIMYVWIFGLMIIAILVVFVMPKFRFSKDLSKYLD